MTASAAKAFLPLLLAALAMPARAGTPSAPGCYVLPAANGAGRFVLTDVTGHFPQIDQKLAKGLSVTIQHEVSRDGHVTLIFGCKIFYDLWDEAYSVATLSVAGISAPVRVGRDKARVFTLCNELALKPGQILQGGVDAIEVTTRLDPVSDEQVERTSQWLASKGISNNSGALFGRAVGAMVNLKQEVTLVRNCKVAGP